MTLLTRFERWDPFDELQALRTRMDRLLARASDDATAPMADWAPTADVLETKDDIVIKTELAGIPEKDVKIQVENGILTIKGERKIEKETTDQGFQRMERSYGAFLRDFTLPQNVDTEKIHAEYFNGLLEVHVPKKESAKPKMIQVEPKKQLSPNA